MADHVIKRVVERDKCCGCGVCAGACPTNALTMAIQPNGDLAPNIEDSCCRDKCSLCISLCPFSDGVYDPRPKNEKLYNSTSIPEAIFNEDIGWYIRSVVGNRKPPELRSLSASGGLATWCLEKLLKERMVTRIAVVRLARDKAKGFFEFYPASTIEELQQSAGSIYHPVEISDIIKDIASDRQQRWAIVGVPCLCAAIGNLGHLRKQIPFVFGLACGMYQNTFYTELLLDKSGVNRKTVSAIEYRRKSDGALASDYRFRGTDNERPGQEVAYKGLPYFLGKNAYFRQNACNYCKDVFAETADACFMDAWLPEYVNDSRGTSLAVIRNPLIAALFSRPSAGDEIELCDISCEQVVQSQRGHVRRKRETISMRSGDGALSTNQKSGIRLSERINWWLQSRTQARSKKAWSQWGRKYGRFVFWLAMLDALVLQKIVFGVIPEAVRLPKRVIRKILK